VAAGTSRRNPAGLDPTEARPQVPCNPLDEENQKLRRENQQLSEELRKAEIVIDSQKKVAALLGPPAREAKS
jgi:cell shape-determining protein MreC